MQFNKITFTSVFMASVYILLLSGCGEDTVPLTSETETIAPHVQANGNPGLLVISPKSDFVVGEALDTGVVFLTKSISVTGLVRVEDNDGIDNTPSVMVNQQVATVSPHAFSPDCPSSESFQCFQFVANLDFNKGEHNISVTVTDGNNKPTTQAISGIVDYCRISAPDPGVPALFQTNPNANILQNNRCHEIDGCSAYLTENDPLANSNKRNDPMDAANHYRLEGSSTAFGIGQVPPIEYFVHGQQSAYSLPCNAHDVCYQTINGMTQQQCDAQMLTDMQAVCAQAYPSECPAHLNEFDCKLWDIEKSACDGFATIYNEALGALGSIAFSDRQTEYRFR